MMSQSIAAYELSECVIAAASFAGGEIHFYGDMLEIYAADHYGNHSSPLQLAYAEFIHCKASRESGSLRMAVPFTAVMVWARDNQCASQVLPDPTMTELAPNASHLDSPCHLLLRLLPSDVSDFFTVVSATLAAQFRASRSASRLSVAMVPLRLSAPPSARLCVSYTHCPSTAGDEDDDDDDDDDAHISGADGLERHTEEDTAEAHAEESEASACCSSMGSHITAGVMWRQRQEAVPQTNRPHHAKSHASLLLTADVVNDGRGEDQIVGDTTGDHDGDDNNNNTDEDSEAADVGFCSSRAAQPQRAASPSLSAQLEALAQEALAPLHLHLSLPNDDEDSSSESTQDVADARGHHRTPSRRPRPWLQRARKTPACDVLAAVAVDAHRAPSRRQAPPPRRGRSRRVHAAAHTTKKSSKAAIAAAARDITDDVLSAFHGLAADATSGRPPRRTSRKDVLLLSLQSHTDTAAAAPAQSSQGRARVTPHEGARTHDPAGKNGSDRHDTCARTDTGLPSATRWIMKTTTNKARTLHPSSLTAPPKVVATTNSAEEASVPPSEVLPPHRRGEGHDRDQMKRPRERLHGSFSLSLSCSPSSNVIVPLRRRRRGARLCASQESHHGVEHVAMDGVVAHRSPPRDHHLSLEQGKARQNIENEQEKEGAAVEEEAVRTRDTVSSQHSASSVPAPAAHPFAFSQEQLRGRALTILMENETQDWHAQDKDEEEKKARVDVMPATHGPCCAAPPPAEIESDNWTPAHTDAEPDQQLDANTHESESENANEDDNSTVLGDVLGLFPPPSPQLAVVSATQGRHIATAKTATAGRKRQRPCDGEKDACASRRPLHAGEPHDAVPAHSITKLAPARTHREKAVLLDELALAGGKMSGAGAPLLAASPLSRQGSVDSLHAPCASQQKRQGREDKYNGIAARSAQLDTRGRGRGLVCVVDSVLFRRHSHNPHSLTLPPPPYLATDAAVRSPVEAALHKPLPTHGLRSSPAAAAQYEKSTCVSSPPAAASLDGCWRDERAFYHENETTKMTRDDAIAMRATEEEGVHLSALKKNDSDCSTASCQLDRQNHTHSKKKTKTTTTNTNTAMMIRVEDAVEARASSRPPADMSLAATFTEAECHVHSLRKALQLACKHARALAHVLEQTAPASV